MQPDAVQPDLGALVPRGHPAEHLMALYQQADASAAAALVDLLSPQLYGFFASQMGSTNEAEDMLQEVWLRIHRVRHTYRAGEPVLPWVYAIAHRVRIDNYRKRSRISSREVGTDVLPELQAQTDQRTDLPPFDEMVAALPESQREVLVMLKVNGLSIEEIACATASTPGAVKQKAHRAYERLRSLLKSATPKQTERKGVAQ